MRTLGGKEMLTQLPLLQHLLQRLVDCKPSGQATHDPVVQVPIQLSSSGLGPACDDSGKNMGWPADCWAGQSRLGRSCRSCLATGARRLQVASSSSPSYLAHTIASFAPQTVALHQLQP